MASNTACVDYNKFVSNDDWGAKYTSPRDEYGSNNDVFIYVLTYTPNTTDHVQTRAIWDGDGGRWIQSYERNAYGYEGDKNALSANN